MRPTGRLRTLGRRWPLLLIAALIGGGAGLAWSMRTDDEPATRATFHAQNHVLVTTDTAPLGNLRRTALFVTSGDAAVAAADALDMPLAEATARVQTIVDTSLGTLTVSGAGETPAEAAELTAAFAAAITDQLNIESEAGRTDRLQQAELEVEEMIRALADIDAALAVARTAAPVEPPPDGSSEPVVITEPSLTVEQLNRVEELELERAVATGELDEARAALDRARSEDSVEAPLVTLQVSEVYDLAPEAYEARLRAGRRGEANYDRAAEDIPDDRAPMGSDDGGFDEPAVLAALGAVAGLLIAAAGGVLLARRDPRIEDRHDVEEHFGLPVLASVPETSRRARRTGDELLVATDPEGRVAEAYRTLRSALVYARVARRGENRERVVTRAPHTQVIMIASAGPAAGKTTVTANLAAALAEAGYRVLALNCDFRRPRLSDVLGGASSARTVSETVVDGVVMISQVTDPALEGNPSAVVAAQRRVIERARRRFDVVLLDTAPLLATNDACELLVETDLVVLVARTGQTTTAGANGARDMLEQRGAPVVGVVLLGARDLPAAKGYYHYSQTPDRSPTVDEHL